MDDSYYMDLSNGRVMVRTRGLGPNLLIALHGYGDQSVLFEQLVPELCSDYRIVAIDLPHHGLTEWSKDSFDRTDLLDLVTLLVQRHPHQSLSLLGFSMGARLWLSFLPECPLHVAELILLAPDGIGTRGMGLVELFSMAARRWMVQRIRSNARLAKGLITLGRQSWLPQNIRYFTARHFRNQQKLEMALAWWIYLSGFPVEKQLIRHWAEQSGIQIQIWLGEQDPLLQLSDVKAFWGQLSALDIRVIPGAGHVVGFYKR